MLVRCRKARDDQLTPTDFDATEHNDDHLIDWKKAVNYVIKSRSIMPNQTPESDQLQAVKKLIAVLTPTKHSRLLPWILAKRDDQGKETAAVDGR